jgi:hypothetical protein
VAAAHGFDLKGPVCVATQGFAGVAAAHDLDLQDAIEKKGRSAFPDQPF